MFQNRHVCVEITQIRNCENYQYIVGKINKKRIGLFFISIIFIMSVLKQKSSSQLPATGETIILCCPCHTVQCINYIMVILKKYIYKYEIPEVQVFPRGALL